MAKTVHRLDEEEKKIIDLIRQHKLDYIDVEHLFRYGAEVQIDQLKRLPSHPSTQRDLDKYTKLLEYLEKGE